MSKKALWLGGGVLIALLLIAGLVGVGIASAQASAQTSTPTPTPPGAPSGQPGKGPGRGGPWGFFGGPGDRWTTFDAVAETLGLTPEALFSELHAGKTLEEIAEAQGVDIQAVQDTMEAARVEAMKQAIAQAVEDGKMTQQQADWLLEGIEKGFIPEGRGFFPMGRGFGRGGHRWHGDNCPTDE